MSAFCNQFFPFGRDEEPWSIPRVELRQEVMTLLFIPFGTIQMAKIASAVTVTGYEKSLHAYRSVPIRLCGPLVKLLDCEHLIESILSVPFE